MKNLRQTPGISDVPDQKTKNAASREATPHETDNGATIDATTGTKQAQEPKYKPGSSASDYFSSNDEELEEREEPEPGGDAPKGLPEAKELSAFVRYVDNDPNELLRHHYLCRSGIMLLTGPTGIGKSSLIMQGSILWAIGKPLFGIHPTKPLKSLIIQAENDDGDMATMRDGVMAGLNLTEDERQTAGRNVLVCREDTRTLLEFFAQVVRPLLEKHKPDLLWIDPALAYLGGEANSQKDVGSFLRNLLNPTLREFNCGGVVVHHTNKPSSGVEKREWKAGDFAYTGSGSAEWGNVPRAVLALRSLGSHDFFELHASKRGAKLGWLEADGETNAYTKIIAHAKGHGVICWHEAEKDDMPEAETAKAKRVPVKGDIMPHIPLGKPIPKETLRAKANAAGIALNRINPLVEELLDDGTLHEWTEKTRGKNTRKVLSRSPKPLEELPLK